MPKWLSYKDAADIQMQADTARDLGVAMWLGILFMYLVLIFQFNNIKYATVIITSVFLTIGGSICILAIFGAKFSFVAQLGIFGVLWVGVNQALIHIEDFKDFYEKKWLSVRDAFKLSISERFVPIFLTKLVTIIGLIILAMKDEMFGWLALAFIGGLIVSFFINLLYIPSLMRLVSRDYYNKDTKKLEL
jgi:multidrug efflux pump subunit AcrB